MLSRIAVILTVASLACVNVARAQQDPAVAVLDNGTDATNVNVVGGFNFVNGTSDLSDISNNQHGTTSSLIINHEAPGIPQYQFITGVETAPSISEAALQRALGHPDIRVIAYITANKQVPSPTLPNVSAAGKFVAIMAGNQAADNPMPLAVAASGLPGVVIVTGTNGGGGLLPNVNACGVTAGRCVGTVGTTEFADFFGSSFATARLAGIAAAVLRAAPYLTNEQVAQVIFATAIDTGDPRLGNGFVHNAAQVINNPAGPSSIADGGGGGGGSGLAVAGLLVGGAVGAALLFNNEHDLKRTLILDSFGRPFHVDLTKLAKIDDQRSSLTGFFTTLEQRHNSVRVRIDAHHSLSAAYVTADQKVVDPGKYFAFDEDPAFQDKRVEWGLSFTGEYSSGFHYRLDRHRDPASAFGILGDAWTGGGSHFLSGQSFSLPVLSFADVADSAGFGFEGQDGLGLNFGLVSTDEDRRHGRDSVAAVVEGSYQFDDRAEIGIQVGQLQEDGSLFGGASEGTFSVAGANTLAVSLSGTLRLGSHVRLLGNYGVARSEVDDARIGMLNNFSALRSNWFGVGMIADEVFQPGDQLGLAFSQPLRVAEGKVDMTVPYARDFEGNIYSHTTRVSLEPQGRQYTLEAYYRHPVDRRSSLGAYVMVRHDPNHLAGAGIGLTLLASYRANF